MKRKSSLLIPAVLAFSLCTAPVLPVLAEANAVTDAASSDTASDSPYQKGTSTETGFESEWLNLKFTPPENIIMNSEEELQSVMKQGQDTLEESSSLDFSDDDLSGTVYEMMASSEAGFPNVSLVVEDATQEDLTEDEYFAALQQMLDTTDLGYTYSEPASEEIGGLTFRTMGASVTVNDYEVLQKYCTRKTGREVCLYHLILHLRYYSRSR